MLPKAASTSDVHDPVDEIRPTSPALVSAAVDMLSNPNVGHPVELVPEVLSQDALTRETLGSALGTMPHPEEEVPPSTMEKIKSRIRRALLRKWVMSTLLGEEITSLVYPWVHKGVPAM